TRFSRDWSSDVCSSDLFGQSPERFPWLFGANILVMMAMNRLNIALLNRYHSQVILRAGLILQAACASLLVLGFALQPQVSLWLRSEERRVGEGWRGGWG